MTRELKPFEGDELELVMDSLANLNAVNFFRRFADYKSQSLMARFDSIPAAERTTEFERLAAQRAVLLNLAEEASRAATDREASAIQETLSEQPIS